MISRPPTATTTTPDHPHHQPIHHRNQPHQMSSNPPLTNRSRQDPSSSITTSLPAPFPSSSITPSNHPTTHANLIQPRRRRVSDGSTGTSLRKDILLSKLAEALTLERNKSNVFQKELQNAEHEIDELASQLDQVKREHYQVISSLKKEIKLLKKEKEGLILSLEAAEGVDQDEADKYLALIDPAQAILIDREEETGTGLSGHEHDDHSLNYSHQTNPQAQQPSQRDHPLEHHETVRAQAQKRSAVRARRINEELSKLGPSIDSTITLETSKNLNRKEVEEFEDRKEEIESDEQAMRGRRVGVIQTERVRRKLSKSRSGAPAGPTGGFWRRSGSRNREGDEVGIQHRYRINSNPSECYDSGSLQNKSQLLSHQRSGSNGAGGGGGSKIGKLFRKVFPVHGNDEEEDRVDGDGLRDGYDIGDEYIDEQKKVGLRNQQVPRRERHHVSNLVGGGGGGGQRRRNDSRTR
ncbi:uncharacterized protein MELLADRAFT_96354 [Melampsora larici-populina 98AG31]|uniref:Uncharacterized protein n=1 Tax=Melampsora larici-populina (strain 98AG31 / pathotype 3-4-7) TaxID=747676 RepID=F4REG8_MELLP|nr:uncharacterized protein MELLADRAFT_96354 [Melampsora larici-populina 98AG31]EGG09273.1 hypothetical protein MELLADRAFT_96354 [Melampsora larici-populina 98AG31]